MLAFRLPLHPKLSGTRPPRLAASTPGISRTRVSRSRKKTRPREPSYPAGLRSIDASSPLRVENPGSAACALTSDRTKRLADTSSTSDAATCATTRSCRILERPGDAVTDADEALSAVRTDEADP